MFRIFIHAFSSAQYGVNVRLVGNVIPDQSTGQLTAVVAQQPAAAVRTYSSSTSTAGREAR